MVEYGRRLASMDFYDIITSFCKTKMLVVESFSSKDDSTIVNLFFSVRDLRPGNTCSKSVGYVERPKKPVAW